MKCKRWNDILLCVYRMLKMLHSNLDGHLLAAIPTVSLTWNCCNRNWCRRRLKTVRRLLRSTLLQLVRCRAKVLLLRWSRLVLRSITPVCRCHFPTRIQIRPGLTTESRVTQCLTGYRCSVGRIHCHATQCCTSCVV